LIYIASSDLTSKSFSGIVELFCIENFYMDKMNGRIRLVIIKPPTIKEIVTINDGS
jgi:hypothetical protein